jgi:hypothetical protein
LESLESTLAGADTGANVVEEDLSLDDVGVVAEDEPAAVEE